MKSTDKLVHPQKTNGWNLRITTQIAKENHLNQTFMTLDSNYQFSRGWICFYCCISEAKWLTKSSQGSRDELLKHSEYVRHGVFCPQIRRFCWKNFPPLTFFGYVCLISLLKNKRLKPVSFWWDSKEPHSSQHHQVHPKATQVPNSQQTWNYPG